MTYKFTIICSNNFVIKLLEKLNYIKITEKEEVEML